VTLFLVMMFLVIFTHRDNIQRLLAGRERKFGAPEGEPAGDDSPS
jgi:glycerol-3-phosphate acyltransferase PlsY